jgi:hypothetical protein
VVPGCGSKAKISGVSELFLSTPWELKAYHDVVGFCQYIAAQIYSLAQGFLTRTGTLGRVELNLKRGLMGMVTVPPLIEVGLLAA